MYYYPVCTFRGRFNISNRGYELTFKNKCLDFSIVASLVMDDDLTLGLSRETLDRELAQEQKCGPHLPLQFPVCAKCHLQSRAASRNPLSHLPILCMLSET